ncbi:hypothetical protein [Methylobacter sp.]|uniref:hypothetical protein n=1 Tax=Methylobacter sp. TaxID=2051955 RepID=UPI002486F2C4|nr:hypothetical protein [Methylobacter sp.]MDI1278533.1 hypothetical protein [Methylobacter sp.]MDI1359310.1 hypothetical protein [Methylobacter sp.]
MSNIPNSMPENFEIYNIYEWSIRKVVFRHMKVYRTYLIGYVPSYNKLEITCVNRIYLEQRLISEEGTNSNYLLCGKSGLTDEAEDIWFYHKKIVRIKYEIDISHKYKDADDELYHNKLIERYGPHFYMFP